jgi:xylan 1,4-beta-xylosidase
VKGDNYFMTLDESIGIRLGKVNDCPFYCSEDVKIIFVTSGKVKVRMLSMDFVLLPGDFLFIKEGVFYRISAISEKNVLACISIDKKICESVYPYYFETYIVCNSVKYMDNSYRKYFEIRRMLVILLNMYCSGFSQFEIDEKGKEIIKYLADNFDFISMGIDDRKISDYMIARHKYLYREIVLKQSELSNWSLKEISEHLGVNYTYFRTDIIERYGHGFSWLKFAVMTENAAKLIVTTDKRLIDISNQCGFSDQKYLRKYIKDFYECRPSVFRKINQNINMNEYYEEINKSDFMKTLDDM